MFVQLIINIFILGAIYTLLAKSFEIIYRTVSIFLLSHALSLTFGVYLLYFLNKVLFLPILLSLFTALLGVVALSLSLNLLLINSLKKRRIKNWEIMIASLGVYVVSINLISILLGDQILSLDVAETALSFSGDNIIVTNIQVLSLLISGLSLFIVRLTIEKSIIGNKIKSLSINHLLSVMYGTNNNTTTIWCLSIGSVLAYFAGVLIALDVNIRISLGFDWLFPAIVAMIIGGMGKMRYIFWGALLLATTQHLSAYFFDSKWMNATVYIILIVFLYFRPYGFSGKRIKKTEV